MRKGWPGTTAALCFCVAAGLVVAVFVVTVFVVSGFFVAAGVPVLLLVLAAEVVVTAGEFVAVG